MEFGTFTYSAFNRLGWNSSKLIWVYIAVNKSPAYVDPHRMTVMCSMQVDAINRVRLLPLLVCTRIQTSPKHQVPIHGHKYEEGYIHSNHTTMADGYGPDSRGMAQSIDLFPVDGSIRTQRQFGHCYLQR